MRAKQVLIPVMVICLMAIAPALGAASGKPEEKPGSEATLEQPQPAPAATVQASGNTAAFIIKDAKTGQDVACFTCHGSTPKYPLLGTKQGYETSGHATNGNSAYANGGGCQQCHTNEGFIEWAAKGTIDSTTWVAYPSQPGCFTCHAPHENGNFDLRIVKPVQLASGATFDLGDGNLCASCHRARVAAPKTVAATPANKISSSWGSHHGPQADIVAGTNAYEFPGKQYSSAAHTLVISDGCVQCHMSLPDGRYGFSTSLGGHSFNVSAEVHEQPKVNTSGCVSCHKDIKQVAGRELFAITAKEDYDLDGTKEPVQDEVQGLLARFVNDKGSGLLQKTNPPLYAADGGWIAQTKDTVLPVEVVAALYNYKMILEDRSLGVHNLTYTVQVLYDSIQALDPGFDVSRRPG